MVDASNALLREYGFSEYGPNRPPVCDQCGFRTEIAITKTNGANFGRPYFRCTNKGATPKGNGHFVAWVFDRNGGSGGVQRQSQGIYPRGGTQAIGPLFVARENTGGPNVGTSMPTYYGVPSETFQTVKNTQPANNLQSVPNVPQSMEIPAQLQLHTPQVQSTNGTGGGEKTGEFISSMKVQMEEGFAAIRKHLDAEAQKTAKILDAQVVCNQRMAAMDTIHGKIDNLNSGLQQLSQRMDMIQNALILRIDSVKNIVTEDLVTRVKTDSQMLVGYEKVFEALDSLALEVADSFALVQRKEVVDIDEDNSNTGKDNEDNGGSPELDVINPDDNAKKVKRKRIVKRR